MSATALKYQIALSLIPGIGNVNAKKLIAYCQGVESIFKEKKTALLKIPGIGEKVVHNILSQSVMNDAEAEIDFILKNNIQVYFYLDSDYPKRLSHCEDGPILLYTKGKMNLNPSKAISIVGTRKATVKGKAFCEKLIEELVTQELVIVSGLAYGIDITAHRTAIKNDIQTIAVLAGGLDNIYPKPHVKTSELMLENGGIVSDYHSKSKILPMNFAERNRIIAGLSDAVIVIESSEKGGSLITAELANGYHRDVFAVPGQPDDTQSKGCNYLIKSNKAALIESAEDVIKYMGLERTEVKNNQLPMFQDLNPEEQLLVDCFEGITSITIDDLSLKAKLTMSQTTSNLLSLEFKGIIRSLPGKLYQIAH